MVEYTFAGGITTDNAYQTIQILLDSSWAPKATPSVSKDGELLELSSVSQLVKLERFLLYWGERWESKGYISLSFGEMVHFSFPCSQISQREVFRWLWTLPFQYLSVEPLRNDGPEAKGSFSDGHNRHGWACAFKGDGHNRLVSRRWLEWGPWRLIRDEENDLSFIQFHDLEVDAETALEQARPGHERMGIHDEGGFIQSIYSPYHELKGHYFHDEQLLEVPVFGRVIPQSEMLEACQARYHQPLGEDKHIKNLRYVFMMEEEARAHLHELWLRELECWAIIEGEKVRLDDSYDPGQPVKPDWVLDLERREA